jgi:hypothetical protein
MSEAIVCSNSIVMSTYRVKHVVSQCLGELSLAYTSRAKEAEASCWLVRII